MTLRPQRQAVTDPMGDFVDPLSNYDPPKYGDELEKSLDQDVASKAMMSTPYKTVDVSVTIHEAITMMVALDIACLLVTENDRLVGVFSERDVLNKCAERFEQIKDHPISLVMTHEPLIIYDTESAAKAINLMAIAGFRHVPILDVDDKVAGIVGPRRFINYLRKFITLE